MGLRSYIAKKILFALFAYFIALTTVFFLYHVMPGNPANVFATDPRVPPEVREGLIERWGLNESIIKQYGLFLKSLFKGDLGYSFLHTEDVTVVIGKYLPWTLLLLGTAFIINAVVGIILGALVAWRRGSFVDSSFVLAYNVYNSIPIFFVGMIFIAVFGYVATKNDWFIHFPMYGAQDPTLWDASFIIKFLDVLWHLVLPLSVLVLSGVLGWAWFMRGNLINIKTEDYIQTARAKGLSDNQVLFRHGFRNAVLPVITSIGMSVGGLIGGAVLVESVFSYPGTGTLIFNAIDNNDYPLLQGAFIIVAGLTLAGLLIAEILYGFIDPRIRNA